MRIVKKKRNEVFANFLFLKMMLKSMQQMAKIMPALARMV